MMLSAKSLTSILLAALLLTACQGRNAEMPVASVYGYELYSKDLAGLVPPGMPPEDSATIVDNYVNQWIRQTVLLVKAGKNVKDDFSRELNEYKNNLIVYTYERQIVDQLLDTVVNDAEIEEYYNQHKEDFLLRNSIVKTVYAVAPRKSPAVAKLKKIVSRTTFSDNDIVDFEETASSNGFTGYYDAETWIPFYTLQTSIPVTAYNEGLFLKQHRVITLSDDSLFYAARILDYKVSDEVSPLELQRTNIRAVILNRRKIEIINRLHADLLKEAEKGGHVKRHKN